MKTLKNHPHYETLKRLHPEAVKRGFIGEWEEIEDCDLAEYINAVNPICICSAHDSGIAVKYLKFLCHKMNIEDLSKLPDEHKPPRDHVCVDGVEYIIGEKYWFSYDGENWLELELSGYDSALKNPWKCKKSGNKYISKTPTPHHPAQRLSRL